MLSGGEMKKSVIPSRELITSLPFEIIGFF
jgi:hypothetical protein